MFGGVAVPRAAHSRLPKRNANTDWFAAARLLHRSQRNHPNTLAKRTGRLTYQSRLTKMKALSKRAAA
ncbi:MAG: hypothetical protein EAZ30_10535 [Betaproteobacteria bacterium]|nr:MAG: hypothetical protein EAZ30_10535 [Betaproteobacteria bacterium]